MFLTECVAAEMQQACLAPVIQRSLKKCFHLAVVALMLDAFGMHILCIAYDTVPTALTSLQLPRNIEVH